MKLVRRTLTATGGRLLGGGVILGYHRIAFDPADPHRLCVEPSSFAGHLDVLLKHLVPVPLEEITAHPRERARRPFALTFDDGYADVLSAALPLLEERGVPATVFVVSGALGRQFRWDRRRGGREGRPLHPRELRVLASSPWIEIGSHTQAHPDLARLGPCELRAELSGSRSQLQDLLGEPVRSLSYPHGGVTGVVRAAAARAGYLRACRSAPGLVTPRTDPLLLPRLWPPDVGGEAFERWLRHRIGLGSGRRVDRSDGGNGRRGGAQPAARRSPSRRGVR